jgi:hypothetical protein
MDASVSGGEPETPAADDSRRVALPPTRLRNSRKADVSGPKSDARDSSFRAP